MDVAREHPVLAHTSIRTMVSLTRHLGAVWSDVALTEIT
jgi:hypothetical protein